MVHGVIILSHTGLRVTARRNVMTCVRGAGNGLSEMFGRAS